MLNFIKCSFIYLDNYLTFLQIVFLSGELFYCSLSIKLTLCSWAKPNLIVNRYFFIQISWSFI